MSWKFKNFQFPSINKNSKIWIVKIKSVKRLFNSAIPTKSNWAESDQRKTVSFARKSRIFPHSKKQKQSDISRWGFCVAEERRKVRSSTWFCKQRADSSTFIATNQKTRFCGAFFFFTKMLVALAMKKFIFTQSICDDPKAKPHNSAVDNQTREWILHNFQLNF